MIVLGIVLGVLIILGLIHVGVRGEYSAEGYFLDVYAGPLTIRLFPKDTKEEKKKEAKKEKKQPVTGDREKKQGADLTFLMELVSAGIEALGMFCRHLRIRKMIVHFTAASEDPFSAAMQFGGASAGAGYLTAVIRQNFHVRKLELYTDVDFEAKKPAVFASFHAGIPVWAVCCIGIRFLIRFFKAKKSTNVSAETENTTGKVETEHG